MNLKDWQRKLVECIAAGGWRSCSEEVRQMFDEVGLAHLDKYAWEGCRGSLCQAVTHIFLADTRMTLKVHLLRKMRELPLPELRTQLRKNYEHHRYVVIGYDGNKLFVNLATSLDPIVKREECTERGDIEICRAERDFGYIDLDFEEVIVTPEVVKRGLPLRVQGDLVLGYIRKVNDLAAIYLRTRTATIEAALRAIVELAFAEAGIAFELEPEGRYIIRVRDTNEWDTYAIAHILHNTISRYVPAKLEENRIRLEFGRIEVTIGSYNHYACTIEVFNDMSRLNGIMKTFADAYYNAINNLQRVDA
ncbi:hypothetical protein [Pyrobaculum neutrophilum]|uniref:Uncharacterized protein n=1 Tax=Pyrobaculum neutrophilum (strain DSM 2338 / JCM 9278 / NBRC 100436 / V24Sta) TaxID=444157 RepID=B1Y9I4_PYRNV|nr:hypothetical protein [Pyrobaculum neutrophilum]ACB40413.1 hypothetical protein Tneu_1489 [Pyrobaculum neutrophilum V24Sta]